VTGVVGGVLTILGEVLLSEFELLDTESTLEEILSLLTSDGDVHCDFLVSLDTEGSDGVSGLGLDGGLITEILKHLGGLGELITGLTSTEVKNEFLNLDLSHAVVSLLLLSKLVHIYFVKLNLLIINSGCPGINRRDRGGDLINTL
jgi:hypothetical protein